LHAELEAQLAQAVLAPSPSTQSSVNEKEDDAEIKDPKVIFETVWTKLVNERGIEFMRFPKEVRIQFFIGNVFKDH
jgi:hypothetical protein